MEGIVYQNKDILFKILGQTYKEKSFAAYGIALPRIRALLPTDLPKISANEKSIDNLFLLEDGTYAIVDYAEPNLETACFTLHTGDSAFDGSRN